MRSSGCSYIMLIVLCVLGITFWKSQWERGQGYVVEYHVSSGDGGDARSSRNCTVNTCLDLHPCSLYDDQLTVFVEPLIRVFDENGRDITPLPSREFLEIRSIIERSRYLVNRIDDACLVVPGFDTLSVYRFDEGELSFWKNFNAGNRLQKYNVLLFIFAGADLLDVKAVIARTASHRPAFRRGFDLSLPLWNPYVPSSSVVSMEEFSYFITVSIRAESHNIKILLKNIFNQENCLVLDECDQNSGNFLCDSYGIVHEVDEVIKKSQFTLIDDRVVGYELLLISALRYGSIPVIISDTIMLPFTEVIDWSLLSLTFFRSRLPSVITILRQLTSQRTRRMREQILFVYNHYFSSLEKITLASLNILERRIVTNSFTTYNDWNCHSQKHCIVSPLFLPFVASAEGFTGVILIHNKAESLFAMIRLLAKVPSLKNVVVVWNHPNEPIPAAEWPHINRPIRIVHMDRNDMSNRFIVFPEITTETVFLIDDSVLALNVDEIEFGYQTWRENSDRLVGFSPRIVFNKSIISLEYTVEWTNALNIVLTGASFYHKYYGMLYHDLLPQEMISYVEEIRNCEDIAMNFLISSVTGKCPLNVTPRNKFVCSKCDSSGISIWGSPRLSQRSACISSFISYFGYNPLLTCVTRHDSVLHKVSSDGPTNSFN